MKEINDGGPAFPVPGMQTEDEYGRKETIGPRRGMSKRDYFAAKAMQGMLAAQYQPASDQFMLARDAYTVADAMIAEGSK